MPTPQEIEAKLSGLQPEEQDAFLHSISLADLDNYAKFSNTLRPAAGGANTSVNGRTVVHPTVDHQTGEDPMESMSDEELAKIAGPEGVPTEQDHGRGFLQTGMGLAARGLIKGATALPALLMDSVGGNIGETSAAIDHLLDNLPIVGGLQRARAGDEGHLDRLIEAGFEGTGGAMAMGAAGAATPGAVGRTLVSEPALQAGSGALGSMAGAHVANQGGSAKEQLVASLLAGSVPGLLSTAKDAAVRGLVRGASPETVRDNVATFAKAGTTPTVGQATGGGKAQAVEGFLSRLFGSSGVVRHRLGEQEKEIGESIAKRADTLGPEASNEAMGTKIGDDAENVFMPGARKMMDAAYEDFDNRLPGSTMIPVGKFGKTLSDLSSYTPGAKSLLTNSAINPHLEMFAGLAADLKKDLATNGGQGLPFSAVKEIRSKIGNQIESATFDSDKPTGDLKRLYGSLSESMKDAAGEVGTPTRAAFDKANGLTQDYHKVLDIVKPVLERNGGPEKVFNAALAGSKDGGTVLRNVYYTLGSKEARQAMTGAILRRAAKPAGGDPEAFDMNRFARNYSNMDDEAKKVVFGPMGGSYKDDLDKVAKTIQIISREKQEHGLAATAAQGQTGVQTMIGAAMATPLGLVFGATAGHPVAGAIASGAQAAVMGGGLIGSRQVAKWMMDPKTVKFLADTTKLPKTQIPIAVNNFAQQADRDGDPDMKALAEYLQTQGDF